MQALYKKLRTALYSEGIDQKTLGKVIARSQTYITHRMTGRVPFSLDDAYNICEYLQIPVEQISEYFPRGGKSLERAG